MMDDFLTYKLELITQGFDFVWVCIILIVCRPRKQWPPYFTLSVHEMRNAEGRGAHNDSENYQAPAPFLVGMINKAWLTSKWETDRCESIDSNDAVLFLNPVQYTVDPDFGATVYGQQISAFDDEAITEETTQKVDDVDQNIVQKGILFGQKDKR